MRAPPHVQANKAIAYLFAPVLFLLIGLTAIMMNDDMDDRKRIVADSLFWKRNVDMWDEV